jgi:hypothetical protein
MNTIVLFLDGDVWMARHDGPHRKSILNLFGTDCIPTAFLNGTTGDEVQRVVQTLNPDCRVVLA